MIDAEIQAAINGAVDGVTQQLRREIGDLHDLITKRIRYGRGSPQNRVKAPIGTLYLRTDGGASTSVYVKESGTGDAGWVAK